jgi:hypothetical protein
VSQYAYQSNMRFKYISLPVFLLLFASSLLAQTPDVENPIPVLTGNAGYYTNVTGGHAELDPQISPVLLVPFGDRWLIEARGEFEGDFERPDEGGPFAGKVSKELDYAQLDYIVNPYVTVTVGRFLTPFNMYNERLYPIWIRKLPLDPLIFPIGTGSSNGLMFRGGFPLNEKFELNYAAYFSTLATPDAIDSDRTTGGRLGFFLPGKRLEAGFSFQHELQDEHTNAFGFYTSWQPRAIPLNLRSEYSRSDDGSGYWITAAYMLNQVPFWDRALRHTEFVVGAQQFFTGEASNEDSEEDNEEEDEYDLPDVNTRQADFGLNYYLRDGLKLTGSYSRQFSSNGNANLWSMGIAYRFALPLGPSGAK